MHTILPIINVSGGAVETNMSVLYDSFAHPSSADGQQHKIF